MCRAQIPVPEYEKLAARFNPVKFDARKWVKVARDAGMKYIVITSKHHDGFAMFDSPSSDYDIADRTPWGRDPMAALARECRKAGIKLCFYYSQSQDWHDPDAMGNRWYYTDEEKKDFAAYLRRKCIPQLKELLTQYGPIGLIWFDTPHQITRAQSLALKRLVHRLQPKCLVSGRIGNNVGDYGSLGDNQHPAGRVRGEWETPCTINDTWGFKTNDHNWKSVDQLVRLLVNCAAKGVNYLLNVGPTAEGVIPQPSIDRLAGVGKWLKKNGEAIYGTQASPFPYDFQWGRVTCKKGKVYLLFTDWPRGAFRLEGLRNKVKAARVLGGGKVKVSQVHARGADEHVIELKLPRRKPDAICSVVALDIVGMPDADQLALQQPDGSVLLAAHMAAMGGDKSVRLGRNGAVEGWTTTGPSMRWSFRLRRAGNYRVLVQTMMDRNRADQFGTHDVKATVGGQTVRGRAGRKDMSADEKTRWHVAESDIGCVRLEKPGKLALTLTAERIDAAAPAGLTVSGVRLVKA